MCLLCVETMPPPSWRGVAMTHDWGGGAATSACSTTSAAVKRHRYHGGVAREKNMGRDDGGECETKHSLIAFCLHTMPL